MTPRPHRIDGAALAALRIASVAAQRWCRERTPEAADALRVASSVWLAARREAASRRWHGQGVAIEELGRAT